MKIIPITSQNEILYTKENIKDKVCLEPFNTVSIDQRGNVRMCGCQAWMPTSIGNIFNNSLEELLESDLAKRIRQSIRDGTYQYCNENTCGMITNDLLSSKEDLEKHTIPSAGWKLYTDETESKTPVTYFIAGDSVCNLSCPSCRTHVVSDPAVVREKKHRNLNVLTEQMFSNTETNNVDIHISTTGEVFASNLLFGFLKTFPLSRYPNSRFWIQTNGLLIMKKWQQIEFLANNIAEIAVTADSCRPDVYAKLRRGGRFNDLEKNLQFLQQLKQKHGFTIEIRMVVQCDNSDEISDFYCWAKSHGADTVAFTRISNWGTYDPQVFNDIDVLNADHELFSRTVKSLVALQKTCDDFRITGFNLDRY